MTQNSVICGKALDQFDRVVHKVTPEQIQWPTPDQDLTVAALIDHVAKNVVLLGQTLRPDAPAPSGDWNKIYATVRPELDDVGDPERVVSMPFGQLPLDAALGALTGEFATHAWDIASAIGVTNVLEDSIGAAAWTAMKRGVPAEGRTEGGPFAPVVDVPDDAPVYDKLAGWTGRDPKWTGKAGA